MRYVKQDIAASLFNALHEANLAACYDNHGYENDLMPTNVRQDDLYGHLAESIKSLGFEEAYEEYLETGDRPNFCFKSEI